MKYTIKDKIKALRIETKRMYPDAVTELDFENNFQLLIAIVMSAQTTDKQVNKVNQVFFEFLKKPEDWVEMWIERIEGFINTVSFYRNKAKHIYKTCEILSKKEIPLKLEELILLPWVWRKTAKVFLAIVNDDPYLWVDTHVHRVLNRVWIVQTKTAEQTDKIAEKILEKEDLAELHHSLIFFWRYHCIARRPKCLTCPLNYICSYDKKETK